MRRHWMLGGALAVLLAGAAGAGLLGWREYDAPGPLPQAHDVMVARGGTASVAQALAAQGVVSRPLAFEAAAWLTARLHPAGSSLHAAELSFPAHASLREVLAVLRTGRPVEHRLTIPEGLTASQVAGLLDANPVLEGPDVPVPEGGVLPQTYEFERPTTRAALLHRAQDAMTRALDAAWAQRSPGLPLSSAREALVLASIVERETARPEERALVAAAFLNRLRQGMKLQADPTVAYAASGGAGGLARPLSRADLQRDDPYNTYRTAGLPPGPICSPGLAAIEAVLHPAPSDALYFVADGSGGHAFAHTLEAHLRNVRRWREVQAVRTDEPPVGASPAAPPIPGLSAPAAASPAATAPDAP